ncbi:MAG: L-serine ammonia-lyase [Planctomycetota bacterium]
MPTVSVFDMFTIGVGPSSSHTLGPWRIVQRFAASAARNRPGVAVARVRFELLGSLALTGKGHATDKAIGLAMLGAEPESVEVERIDAMLEQLAENGRATFAGQPIHFDPARDIAFLRNERHPGHANAIRCTAELADGEPFGRTYFSTGGGFVASAGELDETLDDATGERPMPPFPVRFGKDLLQHCLAEGVSISDIVLANERAWFDDDAIEPRAQAIWRTMRESIRRGCQTRGVLPGGLDVQRRAPDLLAELVPEHAKSCGDSLTETLRALTLPFETMLRLVSCFALAVNEENAAMGRVVTAPTNGAAGVIPAVMMYRRAFGESPMTEAEALRFILVSGQIGALFKQNATISAAMGGCQAEIGVSSAMAAGGLCELMGGTPGQVLMAAEIAMEHHLGMTCDPVGGLVQVPCIERNAMGALKAISSAVLAVNGDPSQARVSFDEVVATMWETAQQMNERYKETSLGGLAVNLSVRLVEC